MQPDGTIYVIDSAIESIPEQEGAIVDYITHLSEHGGVLSRTSVVECFRNSPYAALLTHAPKVWDILHTNTLYILSDEEKALLEAPLAGGTPASASAKPIALISCREIDTVALVDLDRRAVVWALTGMWKGQHQPVITDRGTLLVFDNRSLGDRSRLVEVNPSSQAVVWEYAGSPAAPFNSEIGGALYRLSNGNLFVVETIRGRAFELTREREIVWEFISPHRVLSEGQELVANLYDMVPIAAERAPFVNETSGR